MPYTDMDTFRTTAMKVLTKEVWCCIMESNNKALENFGLTLSCKALVAYAPHLQDCLNMNWIHLCWWEMFQIQTAFSNYSAKD